MLVHLPILLKVKLLPLLNTRQVQTLSSMRQVVHPADLLHPHLEPAVDRRDVHLFSDPRIGHRPALEQRLVTGDVLAEGRPVTEIAESATQRFICW